MSLDHLADTALLELHRRHPARYPVLLESVGGESTLGRYDLLLALPGEKLTLAGDGCLDGPPESKGEGGFLRALDRWFAATRRAATDRAVPFGGGWFLYLGYELAAEIEPTLRLPRSRHATAHAWRMHGALLRDRLSGETRVIAEEDQEHELLAQVTAHLEHVEGRTDEPETGVTTGDILEEDPRRFLDGVRHVLDAIGRGDIYQANLSRGWRASLHPQATASSLYRRLRAANPGPFAGIASLAGFEVLSSSPERLLQVRDGIASTRPIAGTRPRGANRNTDESLARELVLNEKERAEHVMLVDLERNDLGRVCRAGTVEVDEFMTVESYAHVHHIVSNVRGELRPGTTPGQAIAAVFPGGTITGCPKVRCMQLLAEYEQEPRDAYTGSMGYLGLDGSMDLNILIRTLTVEGREVRFRTGAGIVADSRPEAELEETRAKARGLLRALERKQ